MYSTSGSSATSPPAGYMSPPAPPSMTDPYRPSPIPVNARQPYSFSPPPQHPPHVSGGYSRSQAASPYAQMTNGRSRPMSSQAGAGLAAYPTPPGVNGSGSGGNRGYAGGGGALHTPSQLPPARHAPPQSHKGTLAPGQIVQVGDSRVRVEKYLSEGGYAHVYLTTSERPVYPPVKKSGGSGSRYGDKGYTQHCLKRIAFQDDNVWVDVRKEIEVMKALPPNPHLVQYLGSAHTKLRDGTHEVFILMEFAAGGGIIDLLNKRLRDRLKEIEILNIFTDVCEAVAAMHALDKPLLHRDLKIENVLAAPASGTPASRRLSPFTYKLCDFGSTTYPASRPPSTKLEADALALDLNKHTTLQYRSPEMVEPMLGLAVGLPSDVWALGVLLYKLCYYTTPFEEHGTLAIVNAKYSFPQYPVYSPRIQHLIASMLVEQPIRRPTVFEVLKVAHDMSGTRPLIDYPTPSRSLSSTSAPSQPQRPSSKPSSDSSNLLDFTSPSPTSGPTTPSMQPSNMVPAVQPQRRGRPTKEPSQKQVPTIGKLPVPPAMPQGQAPGYLSQANSSTSVPSRRPMSMGQGSAPKLALQVTGEKSSPTGTSGKTDAFGMPSTLISPTSASGTSSVSNSLDAFGVASNAAGARSGSGFSDAFALDPNIGRSNSGRRSSGFGDSFSSKLISPIRSDSERSTAPSVSNTTRFGISRTESPSKMSTSNMSSSRSPPPASKSPAPSSSIPDGEVSFETRFPSIETLHGTPTDELAPKPQKSTSHLISPIDTDSRPSSGHRKPSMIGNMTGGDIPSSPAQRNRPPPEAVVPQPRSTHVTGTAFKSDRSDGPMSPAVPSGPLPRSPHSSTADILSEGGYFDLDKTPQKDVRSPLPEDLMTGDINERMGEPLVPPKLQTGQDADSSDDDQGPESATAMRHPPSRSPQLGGMPRSPNIAQRASMFGGDRQQPSTTYISRSTNNAPVEKATGSQWSPSKSSRPVSMMPSTSRDGVSEMRRPGHGRKGSITEMVSRFESQKIHSSGPSSPVKTPKEFEQPTGPTGSIGHTSQPTHAPKPTVSAKPQALRQLSASSTSARSPVSPVSPAIEKSEPPLSPNSSKKQPPKPSAKPERMRTDSMRTNGAPSSTNAHGFAQDGGVQTNADAKEKPTTSTKPKPALKTKPVDLNRSPPQKLHETAEDSSKNPRQSDARSTKAANTPRSPQSGKSSPEKQQSVNSLIAKWNKM